MKKSILSFLKIVVPIAIGVFLVIYTYNQFTEQQVEEIKKYFRNANYGYLFLSVFFALLSHLSRSWRWNYLLAPMGYKPSLMNNIFAVMVAYLLNLLIPRSGEVSRAAIIQKYEKIPFEKAMGTIITERILDFLILLTLCLTAIFLQIGTFISFLESINIPKTNVWIYLCLVLLFGFLIVRILIKAKHPIILRIKDFLKGFKEGLLSLFKVEKKGWFIFHTLFIWLMYILMFYVCIFALPQTSDISLGAVISSFVVGSIAIAFTNGGFGAYPFLIAEILLLYDISFTVGTAFGWIVWLMQFVLIVLFGGLSLIALPFYNKSKNK